MGFCGLQCEPHVPQNYQSSGKKGYFCVISLVPFCTQLRARIWGSELAQNPGFSEKISTPRKIEGRGFGAQNGRILVGYGLQKELILGASGARAKVPALAHQNDRILVLLGISFGATFQNLIFCSKKSIFGGNQISWILLF